MLENQITTQRIRKIKVRVVFPNQAFGFLDKVEVGSEGQIASNLIAEAVFLSPDEDGNDILNVRFRVAEAKLLGVENTRVI